MEQRVNRYHRDLVGKMVAAANTLDHVARNWDTYRGELAKHAPGPSSGPGGTRSAGISDPTGQAVATAAPTSTDGKWRVDPIVAEAHRAENLVKRITADIATVNLIMRRTINPTPTDRTQPIECRTLTCEEIIETRLSEFAITPYCPACYRWMAEHDGRPVPPRVIADRRRQREHRARHDEAV